MHLLILCTGNSARSILTEALVNALGRKSAQGRITAQSAGSAPMGTVNPLALAVLAKNNIAVDNLRSKSWTEFQSNPSQFDFLVTVCGQAANEVCPVWLGGPPQIHWGFDDPHTAEDFEILFQKIKDRVQRLVDAFDPAMDQAQRHQLMLQLAA